MIYGNRNACDSGHPLEEAKTFRTLTAPGGRLAIICNRCALNRRGFKPEHPDAIHPDAVGKFWLKVHIVDDIDSCWEWLGSKEVHGYGRVGVGGTSRPAHRVAYCIESGGAVPPGLEIDHICRNRGCVRPSHLEAVTHAENMRRARTAGLGPCASGHNNWIWYRGYASCKTCRSERLKEARSASLQSV